MSLSQTEKERLKSVFKTLRMGIVREFHIVCSVVTLYAADVESDLVCLKVGKNFYTRKNILPFILNLFPN